MKFEISIEPLAVIHRLTSLGKLINGLIHNLNGPLQNLSMDLEMMEHTLRSQKNLPAEIMEPWIHRLQRMGREFDLISGLIRSTAERANLEVEHGECGDVRLLLEQEVSFLNTNLYFKHNVEKELLLQEDLPPVSQLPEWIVFALRWFTQSLVEEIEREKMNGLRLEAHSHSSGVEILYTARGGQFSSGFLDRLKLDLPSSGAIQLGECDVGGTLAVALLRLNGASLDCHSQGASSTVRITIPLSVGQ